MLPVARRLLVLAIAVALAVGLPSAASALLYDGGFELDVAPPVAPGKPGDVVVVPGRGGVAGDGPLVRYSVAVEGGLAVDPRRFAREVERVLSDARGWGGGGLARFRRVEARPVRFLVVLASPATTDALCAPIPTVGRFSCASGERAILNFQRWRRGAAAYGGDLAGYRAYMVNHEVGHVLGHGHAYCTAAGARAPVMMQQTKGVGACRPNPWPLRWERS